MSKTTEDVVRDFLLRKSLVLPSEEAQVLFSTDAAAQESDLGVFMRAVRNLIHAYYSGVEGDELIDTYLPDVAEALEALEKEEKK